MLSIHDAYVYVWKLKKDSLLLGVIGPRTYVFVYRDSHFLYSRLLDVEVVWSLDASKGASDPTEGLLSEI